MFPYSEISKVLRIKVLLNIWNKSPKYLSVSNFGQGVSKI